MILAHAIQFFCYGDRLTGIISNYINLTSFSGFLFVFGYVNQLTYFSKNDHRKAKIKLLNAAINILLIYYLSSFAYLFLVSKTLTGSGLNNVLNIVLLNNITPYSEFLLAFFLIALLSFAFLNALKNIKPGHILTIVICCLVLTLFQAKWLLPSQFSLIWGSSRFAVFPIISYLPYFLTGIAFSKYQWKFNFWQLSIATLCTAALVVYMLIYKKAPSRFPPNICWILGAAVFIYIYFFTTKLLYSFSWSRFFFPVERIGSATLFYLILSNIFIFSISTQLGRNYSLVVAFLITFLILFSIYRIQKIVN